MKVKIKTTLPASFIISLCLFFAVIKFSAAADVPGWPSASDAQQALQNRIEKQSDGRIKIAGFALVGSPAGNGVMEVNDEKIYPASFTARVEVAGPCKWFSQLDGQPLTFNTYKLDDTNAPASEDIIEVSPSGDTFTLRGVELFSQTDQGWKLVGFGSAIRPKRAADELSDQCVFQLKQIGLAFMMWAGDNNDKYPFNVSTNAGGTKELCAPGSDGFDANAAMHFQVMSNELSTPKILVCPGDSSKRPAANFGMLKAANVSYLLRSGSDIDESHPEAILARCPIDGNILYCDGHVERGNQK